MLRPYKHIAAYRTGWLLAITDRLIIAPILRRFARKTTQSLTLDYLGNQQAIEEDLRHGAFFLTNHRDICMDSAFLSLLMWTRYNIRPYIGVGNNLFGKWWIEHFVRFNRAFVVIRDGSPRELLAHSQVLSSYLRYLRGRGRSIWLAQREGRAKDGNDRTQPAVLKMLTLSGSEEKLSFFDAIKQLNICPVSISYELDPCDYLKAKEMQLKRDDPAWIKSKEDDILSMRTGIEGQKGRVVYRLTPSINHWIDAHRSELETKTRNEQIQAVADRIDQQIFAAYEIFERGTEFDKYIERRLAMIDLPHKDEAFLRDKLYEMYNNPVKNHENCHFSGII